ncbi:MAG: hypothetical protein RLZZ436_631 [Planctomycetota bacterium]|jgi:hypothetical protein
MIPSQPPTLRTDCRHKAAPHKPALFCGLLLCVFIVGCRVTPKSTFTTERPTRHSFATEHFVVFSDSEISAEDPLIHELQTLRASVIETLQLPPQRDSIKVYLFSDENSYRWYMQSTWRDLPPRRAYFVGSSRDLCVYSFRSPHVEEDLRHEFTHGLLHSCLQTVPLWLDEGLAEYFEVPADSPNMVSPANLEEFTRAQRENWSPGLFRLELISDFRDLSQRDYAECWAWVHFLLNSTPEARDVLLTYVQSLRANKVPGRLLEPLEAAVPSYSGDLTAHIRQLQFSSTGRL